MPRKSLPSRALLLLPFFSSSCIPQPLPEPLAERAAATSFSGVSPAIGSLGTAVVALAGDAAAPAETVGHQYIFGIIPFTSLRAEHGSAWLIHEALVKQLIDSRMPVLTVLERDRPLFESKLQPRYSLSAGTTALTATVYDALFFRVLSIDGDVATQCRRLGESGTRSGGASGSARIPLRERDVRVSAHAPLVSRSIEASLARGLGEMITGCSSAGPAWRGGDDRPALLLRARMDAVSGLESRRFARGAFSALTRLGLAVALDTEARPADVTASGVARLAIVGRRESDDSTAVSLALEANGSPGAIRAVSPIASSHLDAWAVGERAGAAALELLRPHFSRLSAGPPR